MREGLDFIHHLLRLLSTNGGLADRIAIEERLVVFERVKQVTPALPAKAFILDFELFDALTHLLSVAVSAGRGRLRNVDIGIEESGEGLNGVSCLLKRRPELLDVGLKVGYLLLEGLILLGMVVALNFHVVRFVLPLIKTFPLPTPTRVNRTERHDVPAENVA
ncbi:hypothetical protein [Halorubrum halodurans]|uniref:Uncharacterized protein n=1 Tax=Halorubrum halodurans TaxID=1383851 RepID=A0A256IQ19_9EURY|nr:hypothetical protein [Halorubrum halodurans]OYR58644.1 hypothetical protein DJ70_02650 [Halorubrum halodurans]